MRRREFLALLGGAAVAWPLPAHTQQPEPMRRIGVLMTYAADDPEAQLRVGALEGRLRELGWENGRNLTIDYHRAPGGDPSALRAEAARLVAGAPNLILGQSTPALTALQRESRTIPLVFVQVTDPVGAGFVQSLAKPGGPMTGFTDFEYDIGGKWIELLKEIEPAITTLTAVVMAGHAGNAGIFRVMEKVAPSFGVRLIKAELGKTAEIERDIATGAVAGGLIVLPSPVTILHREAIIALALRRRLPAVYALRYFATSGGLMSYGIDQIDQWTRVASYVDRILRGERPADLPVQQPSKFELVINLRTAKALGLEIPPSLLARADEVIE